MTNEELRALADAATPGPWRYPVGGAVVSVATRDNVSFGEVKDADAAFIAAARTEVPRLLDRVTALEKAQRSALDWLDHDDIAAATWDLRAALAEVPA